MITKEQSELTSILLDIEHLYTAVRECREAVDKKIMNLYGNLGDEKDG